jgi:O-antigen/teichoic acid export membrane protein
MLALLSRCSYSGSLPTFCDYQPAFAVGSVIMVVPSIICTVLEPSLSRIFDRGDRLGAERLLDAGLRIFLMVAVPFIVGTLMLGPSLLALLTTPEIGWVGRWVLPLAAAGSLFFGVTRLLGQAAFVLARMRAALVATLVAASVDITLNSITLPIVKDISVVAAGMLAGYAVGCLYLYWAMRVEWQIEMDWSALGRFVVAACAMGTVLWLLGYRPVAVAVADPFALIASVGLGALIYFLVLRALGVFGRRELRDLIDVMQGPAEQVQ